MLMPDVKRTQGSRITYSRTVIKSKHAYYSLVSFNLLPDPVYDIIRKWIYVSYFNELHHTFVG